MIPMAESLRPLMADEREGLSLRVTKKGAG